MLTLANLYDVTHHVRVCVLQLRERLALLRMQDFEETEEKRDKILATKQAKDEELMSALTTIARHRTENSRASAIKVRYHATIQVIPLL